MSKHRTAHAILDLLAQRTHTLAELRAKVRPDSTPRRRERLIFCIYALRDDGYLRMSDGLISITPEGRRKRLDLDDAAARPSVRIFATPAP